MPKIMAAGAAKKIAEKGAASSSATSSGSSSLVGGGLSSLSSGAGMSSGAGSKGLVEKKPASEQAAQQAAKQGPSPFVVRAGQSHSKLTGEGRGCMQEGEGRAGREVQVVVLAVARLGLGGMG